MDILNKLIDEEEKKRENLGSDFYGSPLEEYYLERSKKVISLSEDFENEWC